MIFVALASFLSVIGFTSDDRSLLVDALFRLGLSVGNVTGVAGVDTIFKGVYLVVAGEDISLLFKAIGVEITDTLAFRFELGRSQIV